jgi:hypothetical protein
MSKPNKMLIEANFDVAQVSPTLECKFNRQDPDGRPITGTNAGSVVFAEGEEVSLQINAGGNMLIGGPLPFKSFKVIDCTISTRPRVYRTGPNEKKTVYAPPSPFEPLVKTAPSTPQGATVVLPAVDFNDAAVVGTPEYYRLGQAWSGKLIVDKLKGRRWRLTLMVTVAIDYGDGSEPQLSVYEIDPETEVDNGGPKTGECEPMLAMSTCEVDPETEVDNGGPKRTA